MLDEHGHVRISDLGLACDFSKKKPHACVYVYLSLFTFQFVYSTIISARRNCNNWKNIFHLFSGSILDCKLRTFSIYMTWLYHRQCLLSLYTPLQSLKFYHIYNYGFIVCLYFSGTHGYMAPEVLQKGICYDFSADWFSFGCMIYKLLRGSVHISILFLHYFCHEVILSKIFTHWSELVFQICHSYNEEIQIIV